jgi:hypothetical protein
VTLFDDANDEMIGGSFTVGFLPYPGLIIFHASQAWKVERVQIMIAGPASVAARNGEPPLVDVMVTRSRGVHHDYREEETIP